MIKSIRLSNYKSIVDLNLDLGRFNVLIGENGCGKSNILEGIALASAASENKLDFEYFQNRGIRVTEPNLMFSAFDNSENKKILIRCLDEDKFPSAYILQYDSTSKPPKWKNAGDVLDDINSIRLIDSLLRLSNLNEDKVLKKFPELTSLKDEIKIFKDIFNNEVFEQFIAIISKRGKPSNDLEKDNEVPDGLAENIFTILEKCPKLYLFAKKYFIENPILANYLIFAPEESVLRKFTEYRTYPLGIRGEGLFKYLKEIAQSEDKDYATKFFQELNENLHVLDWFDSINVPQNQMSNDYTLQIKDQYINETIQYFDHNSTNEGFLFLLFYLTLFISEDTPKFFAIDNLEASFNPKMCREITRRLIELSKKYDKQVIITTHNPAILDGLDIEDEDERLFVVRRNIDGHTKANRIEYKSDNRNIPLSEAWMKGYLGGLPNNF